MPDTDSLGLKRVLCATDFSDSGAAALQFAAGLARPCQTAIRLLHVRPARARAGSPVACLAHPSGITEKSHDDLVRDLDACRRAAVAAGVTIATVLRQGDPSEEIVEEAKGASADLIVMGRHGQAAANPFLGSVAESVLRHAPCPVVVVRPSPRASGASPSHVLCALDLGETAPATLEYAVAVVNAVGVGLIVLHVAPEGQAEAARRVVAALVSKAPATKVAVREQVVTGVPYQEILAAAHEHAAGLIVVGTHGGGIVDRQFLGSTTLHLVRESECPVLVVPARVGLP